MSQPTPNITIGLQVEVARCQPRHMGRPRYPGRRGVVVRRNPIARDDNGGLWYVRLSARGRAKERTETFWGNDINVVEDLIERDADGSLLAVPDPSAAKRSET